jgi:hypothetical protein
VLPADFEGYPLLLLMLASFTAEPEVQQQHSMDIATMLSVSVGKLRFGMCISWHLQDLQHNCSAVCAAAPVGDCGASKLLPHTLVLSLLAKNSQLAHTNFSFHAMACGRSSQAVMAAGCTCQTCPACSLTPHCCSPLHAGSVKRHDVLKQLFLLV